MSRNAIRVRSRFICLDYLVNQELKVKDDKVTTKKSVDTLLTQHQNLTLRSGIQIKFKIQTLKFKNHTSVARILLQIQATYADFVVLRKITDPKL